MPTVPRVLVDHCALVHGDTVRCVQVNETLQWGPHRVSLPVARIQGKKRDAGADWLRAEIVALAGVTESFRAGGLRALTSFELSAERLSGRVSGGGLRGDLWRDVKLEHVPAPVDRSKLLGSMDLSAITSRVHQARFHRRLRDLASDPNRCKKVEHYALSDFELESIARLPEFDEICKAVSETRLGDAFHLWTAVRNGLDYFLTTDRKFLDAVRGSGLDIDIQTRVVSPSELLDAQGLPGAPLPVGENAVVPFSTE